MADAIQDNALIIIFLLLIALGVATTVIVKRGDEDEKVLVATAEVDDSS